MKRVKAWSAALAVLLSASSGFGAVIVPTVITGTNGLVNVHELIGETQIDYAVDILDPEVQVYAFAVSNGGLGEEFFSAFTFRSGWSATTLDSDAWDSGFQVLGVDSGVDFNTETVGTYSSFFGNDPLVSLFWSVFIEGEGPITEDSDEIFEFFFGSLPASQFVAFGSGGNVISMSLSPAAVPEPGTLTLAGLGTLGMIGGLIRRRRQLSA